MTIKELNVSPLEVKDLVLQSIIYFRGETFDHGMTELIKYLAIVSANAPDFSTEILKTIFDIHGAGWYFEHDDVIKVLESSVNSHSWEVKRRACNIVHKLGEYGHHWAREYLDRLR